MANVSAHQDLMSKGPRNKQNRNKTCTYRAEDMLELFFAVCSSKNGLQGLVWGRLLPHAVHHGETWRPRRKCEAPPPRGIMGHTCDSDERPRISEHSSGIARRANHVLTDSMWAPNWFYCFGNFPLCGTALKSVRLRPQKNTSGTRLFMQENVQARTLLLRCIHSTSQ